MTTAFVLSGGANLGAVQVGMLQALADLDVHADLLVGTSAGAVNAAYLAGHGTDRASVDRLAAIWGELHAWSLFRPDPRRLLKVLVGRTASVFSDSGLRKLLMRHLTFAGLEDAAIPLQVIATDLLTGGEAVLDRGPAIDAILASCAIPAILPASRWDDGRVLVDGGLADNTAISQAIRSGADQIYVLPCGYACALQDAPRTAWGLVAQTMSLLVNQRLVHDIALYAGQADLIVLPPPCPQSIGPLDFGHADELISRARRDAEQHLARDGGRREDPAGQIAVHTHSSLPRASRRTPDL